jgi:hypothetical protein
MKSKAIKNVALSYACEKNWKTMEPVAGGRFCDSCQYVVHDFTDQSDCQLKKVLQENARVCGRFRTSQLRTDLLKYAAATVIAASGVAINSCTDEEVVPSYPPENSKVEIEQITDLPSDTTIYESYTLGIVISVPDEPETEAEDDFGNGEQK